MTQTQWTFKDENRKETYMQERWRENTPRMMQKDVDACRQWVIFLFINEWAGLGKGSFVAYPSPMWQASSLKGLSPHWQPSPCGVFLFILGSHPNGGANLSPELSLTEDPRSLNLWDLLCFRKISSVNSRCPWFSSPLLFPLLPQPGRISHYPPIEPLPSLGFGSEYRTPHPAFGTLACSSPWTTVSLGTKLQSALLLREASFGLTLLWSLHYSGILRIWAQSPINTFALWLICASFRGGVLIALCDCLSNLWEAFMLAS